jgi:hypothetical protein
MILATGHSARYFELLDRKNIHRSESFRWAEHPQSLIDSIQYSCDYRGALPPAPYSIVKQVGGRGMYSLCMSRRCNRAMRN